MTARGDAIIALQRTIFEQLIELEKTEPGGVLVES